MWRKAFKANDILVYKSHVSWDHSRNIQHNSAFKYTLVYLRWASEWQLHGELDYEWYMMADSSEENFI